MSLLTPPRSSHRSGKENRQPSGTQPRVMWSRHHQIHDLTISPKPLKCTSSKRGPPTKSILKKESSYPLLPLLEVNPREDTPEPADPLMDLHYLEGPVVTILSPLATMLELNEAYGRLMSRLRAALSDSVDADASWPLFQPIRQCKAEFVAAIVRDLRRALEDPAHNFPAQGPDDIVDCSAKAAYSLPSPKPSPSKKRGMSAEQVKYARDLCTTSHSAMRFLALLMGLPSIYKLFTDTQLQQLLTEVIAIPTAETLPTPNARKTWALAIWVIQVQRLSRSVLQPLSIRIVNAIRRGIDGELGKEGKKGAASDGLKAIQDLSLFQPTTFIPAFTHIFDSILNNLLASTFALRLQACQALSGIVCGLVNFPRPSSIHTKISNTIVDFLTHVPASPQTYRSSTLSPSKFTLEAPIIRTLRATLNATEPTHVAQGPVWALVVLACIIVLLGPTLVHNVKIFRSLSTLLSLSMRHKKSSVRALGCIVWRCVAWVYFLPGTDVACEKPLAHDFLQDKRDSIWKALMNVVDAQTGVAIIAAVLSDENADSDNGIARTISVLENMLVKQTNVIDAIETMGRLVSLEAGDVQWKVERLLVSPLFTANGGLLSTGFESLSTVINDMLIAQPPLKDVRCLTREEIAQEWVFDGIIKLWKQTLANLKEFGRVDSHSMIYELLIVWQGLLAAIGSSLQDTGSVDDTTEFARKAADILVSLLEDNGLDLVSKELGQKVQGIGSQSKMPSSFGKTNSELKLHVVSEMWTTIYVTFPESTLQRAGERLLSCLTQMEDDLVESNDDARLLWVSLCIKALAVCEVEAMKMFWGFEAGLCGWDWSEDIRKLVWRTSVEKWVEDSCDWEGAAVLLAAPFASLKPQILGNEDSKKWEELLQYSFDKALDYGFDSITVLNTIAAILLQHQDLSDSASTQVADLLMSHMDMSDIRELPETLMQFVDTTMRSTYPPELSNQDISRWMIRTLTSVIEKCPTTLGAKLLELVQEGMCIWVADEHVFWSVDDYEYEIVPLYAQALFCIQSLQPSMEVVAKFANVIESGFIGRPNKPLIQGQFDNFWNVTYGASRTPIEDWPESIQRCLGLDFDGVTDTRSSLPPSSPTLSEAGLTRPTTPDNDLSSETPTTPPTSLISRKLSLLQRQEAAMSSFPNFSPSVSPTSPLRILAPTSTPITPKRANKRAWVTSLGITPRLKRRRFEGGDKENASPRAANVEKTPPATEHIMTKPLLWSASNVRASEAHKRQLEEEGNDEDKLVERPSPLKRGRLSNLTADRKRSSSTCSEGNESSTEERDVALCLLQLTPRRSPKRRLIMESVEVPTFKEVLFHRRLQRSASLEHLTSSEAYKTPSKPGKRLIQKMRPSNKPTKLNCDFDLFASSSSPIPSLRLLDNTSAVKLRRNLSVPASTTSSSSDDDPRYGQVTPHHLISPAPKKVKDLFDPPSDDSLPPSSPTKTAMSRRSAIRRS